MSSGGEGLFSHECAFSSERSTSRSIYWAYVSILFPFGLAIAFILFSSLMRVFKFMSQGELYLFWHVSVLSVFYVSYINLTRNVLKTLDCSRVDRGGPNALDHSIALSTYWTQDFDVKCYQSDHIRLMAIIGIPCLVIFVVGMPAMLLAILVWRKGKLRSSSWYAAYGFLHEPYREGFQFWEVIVLIRKALLAAITVFTVSLGPNLQTALALAVLMVAIAAHSLANPFVPTGPNLNRMESVSLACSILGFFAGIIFNDPNTSPAGESIISAAFIISFLGVLLYLLAQMLFEIMRGVDRFLKSGKIPVSGNPSVVTKMSLLIKYGAPMMIRKLQKSVLGPLQAIGKLCTYVKIPSCSGAKEEKDKAEMN